MAPANTDMIQGLTRGLRKENKPQDRLCRNNAFGAERERERIGREKTKAQGMDVDWVEDPEVGSCKCNFAEWNAH